ncbi:MAG TPA: tetratricopeptide repeat protein [Pyrinomonadaceae bacterium]|nr:tetratricopeptide repeat protein [Pyrinomonadaceae bacterium]
MAFEKAKVIKAAEKFLSQGKISAAIKEYRQIIKHDEDDLTTLNMLGDLLTRAGEKEEAARCFLRIAEHYRDKEFRLKAIAMYKKIEKLKPRDPVIAKELGALYAAQGLIADARAQYLIVADAYNRAGQNKESLKVLHNIADLDPHNTDIRLKLAEGYLKEGLKAEAANVFTEAGHRLLESAQFQKSLAAYTKALELRSRDRVALRGVVSSHAALATSDEAAELLEKFVADTPDDPELLSMLAQAYIDAEDAAGAERAVGLLMSHDASNYRRYIAVARIYLKLGEDDQVARVLGNIIEPMLAGREENDLLDLINELLARNPEQVAALRLLARVHWWQRDMEKLRAVLERLVEAAEAAGLVDDERYALTQLVRLAPDEPRYAERLSAIGGVLDESPELPSLLDDPSLAAVPSFESFTLGESEEQIADQTEGTTSEFEWNSMAETVSQDVVSFADLNEPEVVAESTSPSPESFDDALRGNETATSAAFGVKEDGQSKDVQPTMRQELESVDFYITQGYFDIALDTLQLLEHQFGAHAEIEARRKKLDAATQDAQVKRSHLASDSGAIDTDAGVQGGDVASPAPRVGAGIDSGLAEIFEEFRLEAEGEAAFANEDFETHYNMATAYKEMDLLDEAIREFQLAASLTGPADGTPRFLQCCNMLGHSFVQKGMPQAAVLWFRKGLDVPGRSGEEYKALQYELGAAYEEMGDLKSAVAAFTEVYGLDVSYRDVADRLAGLQSQRTSVQKEN